MRSAAYYAKRAEEQVNMLMEADASLRALQMTHGEMERRLKYAQIYATLAVASATQRSGD